MKKEKQVCSLKQAKKLKELGVAQVSHFGYVKHKNIEYPTIPFLDVCSDICDAPHLEIVCSAFNTAELGVMIDWNFVSATPPYKNDKQWGLHLIQDSYNNKNEALVRADTLIYMLESKIMSVKACNKRLVDK